MKATNLEQLTQAEAAWLVGLAARSLRDKADVPRNPDGTYNAKSLLDWSRGRTVQATDLPDEALEKLLVITGETVLANDDQQPAAVRYLDAARKRHGDAILLEFADRILTSWRKDVAIREAKDRQPGYAARQAAEQAAAQAREDALANLRSLIVCEGCQRVRRGRKWVTAKVPGDHVALEGRCPTCPPPQ